MSSFLKILFFFCDLLSLNFSILFSNRLAGSILLDTGDSSQMYLLLFSNVSWLYLVMVSNPYAITKGWTLTRIFRSQVAFIFIHSLVVLSLVFFFRMEYSITQVLMIYGIFFPLFFLFKIITYYFRKLLTAELTSKSYIIIGRNELAEEVRKFYLMNGYRFKGYFTIEEQGVSTIQKFCEENEVHEILCCIPNVDHIILKDIVNFGLNSLIKVKIITTPNFSDQPIKFEKSDHTLILNLTSVALDDSKNQLIKRTFDILFSTAFLILIMSWLLPIIAIIIKADSKGPVFFVQLRSGQDNKPFKCLKFRSMKVNVEADAKQATKNDPRITKLGAFLRKSSIDEFPQFFNVFVGSMSVIGPRPHMLKHTEEYSKLIDTFMGRHYVKPGITGLAQCMGYRGETQTLADMENRVRLDRYYIENWTFWLDIKIIFLTVVSLIRGSDKAF